MTNLEKVNHIKHRYICVRTFFLDSDDQLGDKTMIKIGGIWTIDLSVKSLVGFTRLKRVGDISESIDISQWTLDNYFECTTDNCDSAN